MRGHRSDDSRRSDSDTGAASQAGGWWGAFTSPPPVMNEGQSIESREPEKSDDKPAFAGQTRAPYHATAAPVVTTLTDQLRLPWSLAFLPSGKILITEKLGTMRVLDTSGVLSEPVKNVPPVSAIGQVGLLDVALDPGFASNHRVFLTYSDAVGENDSQIVVARASFDEAAVALSDLNVIFALNRRCRNADRRMRAAGLRSRATATCSSRLATVRSRPRGTARRNWTTISARSSASLRTANRRPAIRLSGRKAHSRKSGPMATAARRA